MVKANAIIAYNNRSATEAVPYFEQVSNDYVCELVVSFCLALYCVTV